MYSLEELERSSDQDPIWAFLKSDSNRAKLFDLILDVAFKSQPAESDRLTSDSLRASMARIEFARELNSKLPRVKEDLATKPVLTPEPVE